MLIFFLRWSLFPIVLALAASLTSNSAPAATSTGCDLAGYKTVTAGRRVTVVRQARRDDHRACYGRAGRPFDLDGGNKREGERVKLVRVREQFAALAVGFCSRYDETCEDSVQVTNVKRRIKTTYNGPAGGLVFVIRDLVLFPSGAVSVIADSDGARKVMVGSQGRWRTIAESPDIAAGSLASGGARIYSTEGTEPRSAFANPPPSRWTFVGRTTQPSQCSYTSRTSRRHAPRECRELCLTVGPPPTGERELASTDPGRYRRSCVRERVQRRPPALALQRCSRRCR